MAKVKFEIDDSVVHAYQIAMDTHISRVESQATRATIPSVRDAIKRHSEELRLAKVRFNEAVSGQKPLA